MTASRTASAVATIGPILSDADARTPPFSASRVSLIPFLEFREFCPPLLHPANHHLRVPVGARQPFHTRRLQNHPVHAEVRFQTQEVRPLETAPATLRFHFPQPTRREPRHSRCHASVLQLVRQDASLRQGA